jgi:glycosyltransferase involved in cell wall biosynthesis
MLHIHVIDELKTGGAQTHLITMLREVAGRRDIEHRVVTLFGDGELSGQIRDLGISVDVLDLRPFLKSYRFFAAVRELRTLFGKWRPDLVEAHLTWSRLLALSAAALSGVPKRIGFEQGDLYMNNWKFRTANFVLQAYAQRVVVCSEALADWVHRTHGISRSRLCVLHNCVDLARFRKTGALAPSFNFVGRPTIFATVGTLGRGVNKRTDISIRALASARSAGANVALVICGDGEQRSELEELAAKLDVTSHVKFLGTCSDVPSVLRACDVFCHAAPWEPFGIVAIEAMAIGLPVILPKSGGIQEILRGGEGGLLYEALNHEALAQAMGQLAANRQLCEEMGVAGRRIVEQEFSAERYMQRLYEMYGIDAVCKERKGLGAHA